MMRCYGIDIPESDVPRFPDGTRAMITQLYGWVCGGWVWSDGCSPARIHPAPVSVELVGRMHRPTPAWDMQAAATWDWEAEAQSQEAGQRDFLAEVAAAKPCIMDAPEADRSDSP